MKCVFLMVLVVSVLSQGLMALPRSSDSNQQSANESPLQEVASPTTESLSDESKQSKAIVTSLPEDDKSDNPQTTESDQEVEEDEEEEEEGTSRSARGLELGTYGKMMKRRPSPKSKGARPRRNHGARYGPPHRAYNRPTKYGPPAKTYGQPANQYGQPQRYAPTTTQAPLKYGPPTAHTPTNHGPAVQHFAPSSHMEYVEKNVYNFPENAYTKLSLMTPYEDKLAGIKDKPIFQRVPPSHVAVLPPKVVYGNPVSISFGPSDVSFKAPLTITEEKQLPLTLMYHSPPTFSSQGFKEQPKAPINHANYHESVIPVTEPTFEYFETNVQTEPVTPSAKPNYEAGSNYKIVPNEATISHSDFDAIEVHKPTYEFTMPVNYYGLPAYMSTGNTRYGGKYKFGYRVNDHASGNDFGHEEERDGELTDGRYHVLLPDGRVQNVNYHADTKGYYANVSYKKELQKRHQEKDVLPFEHDLEHLKRQSEDEQFKDQSEETKTEELFAPYEK